MDETITSNENFGKDISVYGDYMVINKINEKQII